MISVTTRVEDWIPFGQELTDIGEPSPSIAMGGCLYRWVLEYVEAGMRIDPSCKIVR